MTGTFLRNSAIFEISATSFLQVLQLVLRQRSRPPLAGEFADNIFDLSRCAKRLILIFLPSLIFSMEEVSLFWSVPLMIRIFVCAMAADFTANLLASTCGGTP